MLNSVVKSIIILFTTLRNPLMLKSTVPSSFLLNLIFLQHHRMYLESHPEPSARSWHGKEEKSRFKRKSIISRQTSFLFLWFFIWFFKWLGLRIVISKKLQLRCVPFLRNGWLNPTTKFLKTVQSIIKQKISVYFGIEDFSICSNNLR